MALSNHKLSVLVLIGILSFVLLLPKSDAAIAKYDEYLKKKAQESLEESRKAFNPNPEEVADDLNVQVSETLTGEGGKRNLRQGGCKATNPIDRCWRCDPNWAKNRKKLAECARGFGHRATGGKSGKYYVVTDPSDNDMDKPKPGTLRHAVIQPQPLWITFGRNMVIKLKEELIFASDKTVDGRGAEVHIAYGAGITLQFVHNVIIHNIWIHDIVPEPGGMIRDAVDHIGLRTRSDGDGISVFSSNNIWIDHVSLSKGSDGLIDVIEGSTAITISNCKFNHHNDFRQRFNNASHCCIQPLRGRFDPEDARCRQGFAHVINNDYANWEMYAIGGSAHSTIISQGNRFKASNNPFTKQVMLLGAHDSTAKDSIMQITVAFNRFGKGLIQRMPRIRWGFVHVINNDYSHWEMYAIGGSAHPTIISQGNRFKASKNPRTKEVTKRIFGTKKEWEKWQWRSEGDKFTNGAYFVESGPPIRHEDLPTEKSLIKFKPGSFAGRLTRYAGALKCREGKLC
ncbi:UNVERIFIED_CONTAM: Pectate lyase [Sesamum latifolium]|uniref:Pectate lyase n=1 Tax=Sesamum latifolium TaxID=2727402 RepID=A0AAW2UUM8_9LAMI